MVYRRLMTLERKKALLLQELVRSFGATASRLGLLKIYLGLLVSWLLKVFEFRKTVCLAAQTMRNVVALLFGRFVISLSGTI